MIGLTRPARSPYAPCGFRRGGAAGFDDAFQYEDFAKPWGDRRIKVSENFEREVGLKAYEAWSNKKDRHPY